MIPEKTLPYKPYPDLPTTEHPVLNHYSGDVGLDIAADLTEPYHCPPHWGRFIPGSFRVDIPDGYFGLVVGRSSSNTRGLLIPPAIIDNGYQGVIGAQIWNISGTYITVEPGDRIAQLVLLPAVRPVPLLVEEFSPTDRGDNGWGSTGK
jgi:dUTP pyrophosphatase